MIDALESDHVSPPAPAGGFFILKVADFKEKLL
jgi:hypothetical protein